VSGIGELAENIVNYRSENGPFENRKQLKKLPRLGETYQQGAAFIRISNAKILWIIRLCIQSLCNCRKNGQRPK
jgi:transcriptional accessory protein Tex/SPT6